MTSPADSADRHDDATFAGGTAQVPVPREPEPESGPAAQPEPDATRESAPVPAYPPPIDPRRLLGSPDGGRPWLRRPRPRRRWLGRGWLRRGGGRVAPLQTGPSDLVARYLFPTERFRGEWRRHSIDLSNPIGTGIVATIGLGVLASLVEAYLPATVVGAAWVIPVAALIWLGVMGWAGWRIANWHYNRFILTNKRVMRIHGVITRDVAMLPLGRVTDMKYQQTPMGRLLNYGTFVIESAGQDQALREIPYLPRPNDVYLQVVEEMYEPDAVEARLGPAREEEQDDYGDA